MKRIAIQLFGHMRTWEKCINNFFTNILKENDAICDVFIHTWNEKENSTIAHNNEFLDKIPIIKLEDNEKNMIQNLYRPQKIIFDNQIKIKENIIYEKLGAKRSINGILNNAYTVFKVNELRLIYEKENNVSYDFVIQTRPDILFKTPFSLNRFFDCYERNKIEFRQNAIFYAYNPYRCMNVEDEHFIAGSDLIYFSSSNAMNKATALYLEWNKFLDVNNFYSFEYWWLSYWKKQNLLPIPINYIQFKDFEILRLK